MNNIDFTPMVKILRPGELGKAKIVHYEVTKTLSDFTLIRSAIRPDEYCPPGNYAQLFVNGTLVMSDTTMEQRSNREILQKATGHTLIAGLGLGMILVPILRKEDVTKVTVIEKSQDVIDLVLPQLKTYLGKDADKLEVICANVFEWKPPKKWLADVIYFDIWPDICDSNLKDISLLHRRFTRKKTTWMGSWMHGRLKSLRARSRQRYF